MFEDGLCRAGLAGASRRAVPGRSLPRSGGSKICRGFPDAVFIGVNRQCTIETVRLMRAMGAGGAVCFASGFARRRPKPVTAAPCRQALLDAAGDHANHRPNCYGFINYLDGALLWPDQHGGQRCARGVAVLTQSSNMAINLTMQARGLPLAYVVTAGNQAQLGLAGSGRRCWPMNG